MRIIHLRYAANQISREKQFMWQQNDHDQQELNNTQQRFNTTTTNQTISSDISVGIMEQFSHDLTLALEETSKCGGVRTGRWGVRRRTRSTGNLPCAPQPTEDSSSSPADGGNNCDGMNAVLSDSDDRQELKLSLNTRQSSMFGNFESDSLNENLSPARPNTRRKRKFKRMAVEYETTPSTPGTSIANPIFPITGTTVKKRVFKHNGQENFRANLFFCGKRKRSHRDRYFDQHSSSVPRQRDIYNPKNSYSEYRSRNRSFSSTTPKFCERIMPLNNSIVSKIEKISQDSRNRVNGFRFLCMPKQPEGSSHSHFQAQEHTMFKLHHQPLPSNPGPSGLSHNFPLAGTSASFGLSHKPRPKSDHNELGLGQPTIDPNALGAFSLNAITASRAEKKPKEQRRPHKHNSKRQQKLRLQFDDPNLMECNRPDLLSSSSMSSSSDSEAVEANDTDREGDDELTDWPGNEAMVNFASKNDFKRAKPRTMSGGKTNFIPMKSEDWAIDDDTLMSADEMFSGTNIIHHPIAGPSTSFSAHLPPTSLHLPIKFSPSTPSAFLGTRPIEIRNPLRPAHTQIDSEMSGETSNNFASSPSTNEVREIRAGCRRIRNERPGFTILTSVNEDLSKFLQDARQEQLTLPDTNEQEHEKLTHLANLYSLSMHGEGGCVILTKTSNTMQSVKIDQTTISKRFLSDYKRRCYDGEDDPESSGMAS